MEEVEVTIRVPRGVIDFLRHFDVEPEEYILTSLRKSLEADIDASQGVFFDKEWAIEKFNLKGFLEVR